MGHESGCATTLAKPRRAATGSATYAPGCSHPTMVGRCAGVYRTDLEPVDNSDGRRTVSARLWIAHIGFHIPGPAHRVVHRFASWPSALSKGALSYLQKAREKGWVAK